MASVDAAVVIFSGCNRPLPAVRAAIRAVRRGHPAVGVVVVCSTENRAQNCIAGLCRAGATHILFEQEAAFAEKLRAIVQVYQPPRRSLMQCATWMGLPRIATDVLLACGIGPGTRRRSIKSAAVRLCVPRRTLYARHRAECGLTPRRMIGWTMVIGLVSRLENTAMTFEAAAVDVGYDAMSTARRHLHTYAGCSVREARQEGALCAVLALARAEVRRKGQMLDMAVGDCAAEPCLPAPELGAV